jgi:nitrile hydratase beta subunit-like protein
MPHVHDRGGWPDAGPIDKAEHDYSLWEKRTDALLMLLAGPTKRLLRVDELRRAIESLPPDAYEKLKYYERWITAIEALLVEKGILTPEEIDRKAGEYESE